MSFPINISLFGGGNGDINFTQYNYSLTLYSGNDLFRTFQESTNEKYINIIKNNDNILFSDIKSYDIRIDVISLTSQIYSISNKFIIEGDQHIYNGNNIYIEFKKLENNMTNCCISVIDNDRVFFTPPKY
jgi:hypothetical protein